MVDASVGGKTGINFGGLKNEVGVFNDSKFVILDTEFLKTLDAENICSGYAEMLKLGLISTEAMWEELVSFDLDKPDLKQLQRMVGDSVNENGEVGNLHGDTLQNQFSYAAHHVGEHTLDGSL